MFEDFEPFTSTTQSEVPGNKHVNIYGLQHDKGSSLPPLLLLHGFPQSRHIWHRVAPQLLGKYSLVIPDLRGYGASSKPETIAAYAKSAMAKDMVDVMDQLGYTGKFYVCAHDRGARVAHKLCVDFPDRVEKVIFLDISPTLKMYESTSMEFANAYFHWFFLIQRAPLPETLISAKPREVAKMFMGGRNPYDLGIFDEECFEYYSQMLEDPVTVHAMCNDYRASATLDMDESRVDIAEGRLIQCPVRVVWGKHGVIEKLFDAVEDWKAVTAKGVDVGGYAVESGHYIPEQVPDEVVKAILEFFV